MQQLVRTLKLKLYPTARQRTAIQQHIGTNRYVYNYCLAKNIEELGKSEFTVTAK